MEECRENLQPALDHIKRWTDTWKVQMSASKCAFTTFTLNPMETNGKLLPNLFLGSEELRYDPNPVFLGITLDDQLTFSQHVERARKTMAQRAGSVAILSGKSYGSHPDTLRIAYISYVRSCWEYGACVYMNHAAPTARAKLEAQQNRCARIITGCLRNTKTGPLIAEADLQSLSLRAKELAAREYGRILQLPDSDPTRQLLNTRTTPRLKYRAREAWQRNANDIMPDEDCELLHKPCFRRVAEWIFDKSEVSIETVQRPPKPTGHPWSCTDRVKFVAVPRNAPRRNDPPEVRKAAAEENIRKVEREISVWTDGSSVEGIGGGGGIILVGNSEQEIRQPAGKFCSSTKAELVAVAAALKRIGLDEDRTMAVFSDSRAAIQALQAGPLRQRTPVSHEIWNELLRLQGQGCQVTFHWVPGHADIDLNERADRLANEARALPNADDILDYDSLRTATRLTVKDMQCTRARRRPDPGGLEGCNRWERCTISQLKTGRSPLTRDTMHLFGKAADPLCPECEEEEDSVEHLLCRCPMLIQPRHEEFGPDASLETVLQAEAKTILRFLERVGRKKPPVDAFPVVN